MQNVWYSKYSRNQWTLFIQWFTFVVVPAWYHEEAACLSSQLVGLAIQGFQHSPQVGCISRSSWVEIFCQAWKYKTGYLLPAPVRLYLCCLLEIIWEQIWIFFHVPIFRITPQLCKPHTTHNPSIRSDNLNYFKLQKLSIKFKIIQIIQFLLITVVETGC